MDLEGKWRARLVGWSSHVNWRRCFMPGGWGRPSGSLLSWHPDLAGCPGPSGCSLLAPLPSYFKASLFSETLASFSMKLSHQVNFLTPFLVPPKSQP